MLHPGGDATTRRALELVGARAGERLLDVASGTGASVLLAAREQGCIATGVEWSEPAVEESQAAAEAAGLASHAAFVTGDAESLPFGDGEFDSVLCECSLCLFGDKPRALAEIRRVLRPGGRLALADVVAERDRLPVELLGALATVACVGDARSRDGYLELLSQAGLRPTATEPRDDDAAILAERILDRLRGARVLGVDRAAGSPIATEGAIDLVRMAREAIGEGALGYAIFAATRR